MRLFVAVWPPPALVEQLARLERPQRAGVRWTTADQWHVTLRFLGEVADMAAVDSALQDVGTSRRTAVAGPTVQRVGKFVLALPVAGLEDLAAAVNRLTAGVTAPLCDVERTRPFRGHLTLARGRSGVDLRPLASAPVAAAWPVDDVTLVASGLHPGGARYEVVGRYRLRAGSGAG